MAAPALREIDRAAPVFTRAFDRLPAVSRAARRGLPSTTRLLADAPVPLRRFNEFARELIPFLQLVAADRGEITGVFANVGTVRDLTEHPGKDGKEGVIGSSPMEGSTAFRMVDKIAWTPGVIDVLDRAHATARAHV